MTNPITKCYLLFFLYFPNNSQRVSVNTNVRMNQRGLGALQGSFECSFRVSFAILDELSDSIIDGIMVLL